MEWDKNKLTPRRFKVHRQMHRAERRTRVRLFIQRPNERLERLGKQTKFWQHVVVKRNYKSATTACESPQADSDDVDTSVEQWRFAAGTEPSTADSVLYREPFYPTDDTVENVIFEICRTYARFGRKRSRV